MNRFIVLIVWLCLLSLVSCQEDRPHRYVLEKEELVPIIVDFHLLYAIQSSSEFRELAREADTVDTYSYIFDKHGISKAEFDSSIAWYSRHPKLLTEIYDQVVMSLTQMQDSLE